MALVIIGAGDHARVVLEGVRASSLEVAAFIHPTATPTIGGEVGGLSVAGSLDDPGAWLEALGVTHFIVALGSNAARSAAYDRCVSLGLQAARMIHPSATILGGAEIGPGSQVCAGAVIGVDARIGADVIVNTLASVDHDVELGDHAFIAPGAHLAGRVRIGVGGRIGIGASVREGTVVGEWATVAAGAVVVRDVPRAMTVAGVPARPMNQRAQGPEVQ